MNIFQTLILSIVEGITEFLPISSTGHLILTSSLLQIVQTEFVKSFEIAIQFGAILAVVVLYFQKFLKNRRALINVFIAFFPTAIIGFVLYKIIKQFLLGNSVVVIVSLIVGGVVLILIEKKWKQSEKKIEDIEKLTVKRSLLLGVFQALAVIPGVSRSASTIIGGMFLGLSRSAAAEFSFLLAVPTMAAATVLDLTKSSWNFGQNEYYLLGVGMLGSFVTALLTVKWFIRFVQTHNFVWFGIYRIAVAILVWVILYR